jgi:HSP20 family molecular chaperone IbpA
MSRVSMFNSPLLLGFEHFERALDRVSKTASDGYPPYNIERRGEDHLRITLAVAGFGPEDLEVRIEDTQLVIRGRQTESDDPNRVFLYRGIAGRQFQRSFVLSDGIEVVGASLDNGLLHVDMQRIKPEPQVRTVQIDTSGSTRRNIDTRRDSGQTREAARRQGDGATGPARNGGRTSRG